jgi:hypothetical protein
MGLPSTLLGRGDSMIETHIRGPQIEQYGRHFFIICTAQILRIALSFDPKSQSSTHASLQLNDGGQIKNR